MRPAPRSTVAYVMNGFPRLSETFITHEIHQLERLGMDLRLYSVKREDEPKVHPVVAAIRAPLTYLPKATLAVGHHAGTAGSRDNLPRFWRAHAQVAWRHPLRWCGALGAALALAGATGAATRPGACGCARCSSRSSCRPARSPPTCCAHGDVGHLHGHFCHGVATITWFASRMTGIRFSFTAHAKDIYQAELNPGRPARAQARRGALRRHLHLRQRAGAARAPPAARRGARDLPRPGHRLVRAGARARRGHAAADPRGRPLGREEGLRPADRSLRAAARRRRARSAA